MIKNSNNIISDEASNLFKPNLNNFDLIRLLAALQVVVVHSAEHFGLDKNLFVEILEYIPGVPIFFFISGVLIVRSYQRTDSLTLFYHNRLLRIYPGLWGCFLVSCAVVLIFYRFDCSIFDFSKWAICQITVLQFFNPDFLREFGVGVLNGSLWTIPIELQFYLLTPFIAKKNNIKILLLLILFITVHFVFQILKTDSIMWKLVTVSFIPWFCYFLLGAWVYFHFDKLISWFRGKFFIWLAIYIVAVFFAKLAGMTTVGNNINFTLSLFLIAMIMSFAFSFDGISFKLLKRNDISYGVYIYHMLIINIFIQNDFMQNYWGMCLVIAITSFISFISWRFVEKRCLKLKLHHAIKK